MRRSLIGSHFMHAKTKMYVDLYIYLFKTSCDTRNSSSFSVYRHHCDQFYFLPNLHQGSKFSQQWSPFYALNSQH